MYLEVQYFVLEYLKYVRYNYCIDTNFHSAILEAWLVLRKMERFATRPIGQYCHVMYPSAAFSPKEKSIDTFLFVLYIIGAESCSCFQYYQDREKEDRYKSLFFQGLQYSSIISFAPLIRFICSFLFVTKPFIIWNIIPTNVILVFSMSYQKQNIKIRFVLYRGTSRQRAKKVHRNITAEGISCLK